jgi:formamidopyrimidine-DNA glycosylase
MPELPEVETIRQKIAPLLTNNSVKKITSYRKDLRIPIPQNLNRCLKGNKIIKVRRRSKYLWIDFEHGYTLTIHLGMSGRFFFTDKNRELDRHDHVCFDFEDGKHMRFRDPRRFGLIALCLTAELSEHKLFQHLGVEPLSDAFDAQYFFSKCQSRKTMIKNVLMDAKVVVGVGNIYSNEALFLSGINPQTKALTVSKKNLEQLCVNTKKVLEQSIAMGGTSFRDYVGATEEPGLHQIHLKVYGREGEPCNICGILICREVVAGRSLFYCPNCQKMVH